MGVGVTVVDKFGAAFGANVSGARGATGTELVCTVGRVGGEPCAGFGGDAGIELLKSKLRLLPLGLGLRLLKRDMGLVNPLW